MRVGDRAGRHRSDIDRQVLGTDVFAREPLLVLNTVPAARAATATQHAYAIEIFNLAQIDLAGTFCLRNHTLLLALREHTGASATVWGERHTKRLCGESQAIIKSFLIGFWPL